ncbi:PTS mannose/fructose/sorbose transporter subunit IIB [Atopobacter sp. AH10]|uniref:PTS sugar transporter subunit IIB n=1 Tax=Atopobacter sp. AH10 TaxID=2315861 RepID=UPI000EF185AD|nr:PTS sugar transporter subunit IIB [Atopobacter sp. AH10]RLK63412.1 PTS mannose/fructose/sorbose transporter subunit IIB [Atopobacter sp. AH10]
MIVHARCDCRVIHGQTTTRILKDYSADGIIVVDDEISKDKFMIQLYRQVLPKEIKVFAFSIDKALNKLKEADNSSKEYILIFKSPLAAKRLVEAGYKFLTTLFIGPQNVREKSTFIVQMIGLLDEEMEALDYLEEKGVKVILNPTFTTPDLTWSKAKAKLTR